MIVVGGEALVDLVIDPAGSVIAKLGGGPFNTARTIGRLGQPVTFCGCLSTDRFGTLLAARLVDDGVDGVLVQRSEKPTTLAAAELDASGSARYHFYFDSTSAPALNTVTLPPTTTALHVGTLGFVLQPMATTLEHLVTTAADDVLVMADPNCRPTVITDPGPYLQRLQRVFRRCDVVKVSTEDLEFMYPGVDQLTAARQVLTAGAGVVLLTAGSRAVHILSASFQHSVAVPRVEVVDTIGAGDSFGGAFIAWWAENSLGRSDLSNEHALTAAAEAAVDVAARTCQRVGADPPKRGELGPTWGVLAT